MDDSRYRLSSEGVAPHTAPHRVRMPWTHSREAVPVTVYRSKDRTLIEGIETFKGIGRVDQLEPLVALKAICARRRHIASNGLTLFQVAAHLKHNGRGQIFWRDGWRDGTCDKYITLSQVRYERGMEAGGEAWGYLTFQGESTLRPVQVPHANVPGWHVEYIEERAVSPTDVVDPPPSIGTEVPIDPKQYKLKAYPYYDAPLDEEWEMRRLEELGIVPDPPAGADGSDAPPDPNVDDGSVHVSKS